MASAKYENRLVDAQASVDFSKIAGKTVVITGGMFSKCCFCLELAQCTNLLTIGWQVAAAWAGLTSKVLSRPGKAVEFANSQI